MRTASNFAPAIAAFCLLLDPGISFAACECCVGAPGFNDPICQSTVCAVDPFCCSVACDALCALEAASLCGPCDPQSGACCFPNGTCLVLPSQCCVNAGGTALGAGTLCQGDNNSNGIDDTCETSCVDPPPDMISWYPADDCDAGDTVGPNDGTFSGVPFCPVGPKVGGGALGFSGLPPTFITVPGDPSLNFGNRSIFSIDLWFRTPTGGPIIEKGPLGGNPPTAGWFLLEVDFSGLLSFSACDLTQCYVPVASTTFVADGLWHHGAVTVGPWPGSGISLYVDGILQGAPLPVTVGSVTSTQDMLIGASGPPTAFFDGAMDEIEIFGRVLTLAEIKGIYDADSAGKCKCEPLPDGSACTEFCRTPGMSCQPTEVTCPTPTGCIITACGCVGDSCHVELGDTDPPQPTCVGTCPQIAESCQLEAESDGEIGLIYRCTCGSAVPALSEWGLAVLAAALLVLMARRRA